MATKTIMIQIRYTMDHPDQFAAVVKVMQKMAADAYARIMIASGPDNPPPQIKILSEDSLTLLNSATDAEKVIKEIAGED